MTPVLVVITLAFAVIAVVLWRRQLVLRRDAYIRSFVLPRGLFEKLRKNHPQLTLKQCQLVAHGLRQFFMAHLKSGNKFVSMPSQIADDMWHEFILYTKHYEAFCRQAFGRFFHHTPAVVLTGDRTGNTGLRRCWWYLCREENINPRLPTRLPLLFALDAKLGIPGGFHYIADCNEVRRRDPHDQGTSAIHCGGDFADPSIDGGVDGMNDSSAGSVDGSDGSDSSDGGGGGGCGGGGD